MLWHADLSYYYPGVVTGPPRYYWTNVFSWVQSSGSTPDPDHVGALAAWRYVYCRGTVFSDGYRVRSADGAYDVTTSNARQGLYGSSGSFLVQPMWFCLLRGLDSAGNMVAYKRLRGGWYGADIHSKRITPAVEDYVNSWVASQLNAVSLTSWVGTPVANWVLDPTLRLWQRRQGSRRAARPVIAIP